MIKKLFAIAVAVFALSACGGGDDELSEPTVPETGERYFTLTNGDSQYDFTYMGGIVVHPSETTQKITLYGVKSDYQILWHLSQSEPPVKQVLHIDMTGKPFNITENYTVRYEQ